MERFQRNLTVVLVMQAETEQEAWEASDLWVQALMVRGYEAVRQIMETGSVRVMAADQSHDGAALLAPVRDLAAFLQAGDALRQAQDDPDTRPEDLRRAREDYDHARQQFDVPFTDREI